MKNSKPSADIEVKALSIIVSQIDSLNTGAQARVLEYLSARYPQFDYEKIQPDHSILGIVQPA